MVLYALRVLVRKLGSVERDFGLLHPGEKTSDIFNRGGGDKLPPHSVRNRAGHVYDDCASARVRAGILFGMRFCKRINAKTRRRGDAKKRHGFVSELKSWR